MPFQRGGEQREQREQRLKEQLQAKEAQGDQERYKDSPAPRVSKGLAFPSTSIMDIRTFVMEATGDKST